jgi:hypothetical protein
MDAVRPSDATDQQTKLLVLLRVVLAAALFVAVPHTLGSNLWWGDAVRYGEIADGAGHAYRDRAVEYPPVTLAVIEAIGFGHDAGDGAVARGAVVVSLVADLAAATLIGWGFGKRARRTYLLVGLPLVLTGVPYLRLDLVTVALAAGGLALCRRGRSTAGGLALVAGGFAKLWPLALLPILVVQRRWRALGTSLAAGAAGLAAWVAYGGVDGPRQVLTLRGAHGWQLESLPGSLVHLVSSRPAFFDAGAWRVGTSPGPLRWALVAAGLAVIAAAWWRAWRRATWVDGAPLVAVATLLLTSAVLSPQFLLWMLPCVALLPASSAGVRAGRLVVAASVLTALMAVVMEPIRVGATGATALVVVRNLVLVAAVVAAWRTTAASDTGRSGTADAHDAPLSAAA